MITITSCKQEHTKAYKALCELVMPCRVLCISVGQIYDLGAETIDGLLGGSKSYRLKDILSQKKDPEGSLYVLAS